MNNLKQTDAEKTKEWRKNNPEKVKAYAKMRYKRDIVKIKEYAKKYDEKLKKENPEKYNESLRKRRKKYIDSGRQNEVMKRYYQRNKNECASRELTRAVVFGQKGYRPLELPNDFFKCVKCGCTKGIEIHHEVYPRTKKDIIILIGEKKIFMVCDKHHKEIHRLRGDYKDNKPSKTVKEKLK